jgi:hypothetical protein
MSVLEVLNNAINGVKGLVNECIIIARNVRWSMIRFANNEPTIINNWLTQEVGLYVAKSRRYITASLTSINARDISNELQRMVKRLENLPEDELYTGLTHVGKPSQLPGSYDKNVEVDVGRIVDKLNNAINASLSEGSSRNAGALTFGVEERYYVDTTGLELEDKSSFVTLTIRAFLDDVSATSVSVSRTLSEFKPENAGREAGSLVALAKGLPEERIDNGRYDVLLGPLVAGHLYGLLASTWFNAYSIIRKCLV